MTSNHPERLDPALIRPGRIDKQILLGYIRPDAAAKMIAHYFALDEPLTGEQTARLAAAIERIQRLSPATMEQLCAEHRTVDALIDTLTLSASRHASL